MSARVFASLALLLAAGAPAQSPPGFSGSVVVTATGDPRPADEVAAATTVIDADEIAAAGSATVAELLRLLPGAELLRSGLDTGVTTLFLRGASSAQTLVLFDGIRLNSPYFGGYDWSLPLTAGLERIEVVRGPYSALYGADAVGGVVQLVPDRTPGRRARLFAEGGADGWRRGELSAGWSADRWSATVAAGSREGSGTLANDDFLTRSGLADVGYSLGSGGRLGLLVHRSVSHTGVPFDGARLTPHRRTAAEETLAAVPLRLPIGGGELEGSLSRVERTLTFRDPDDPYGFVASDTRADSDAARLAYRLRLAGHRLAAGAEWRRDLVNDASSLGNSLDDAALTTRSLFVQDEVGLGAGLGVLAGVRWDEARPWGSEISPRAVLSWQGKDGVRVWLSAGRAFRAPALGELYYPYAGNPELHPERSRSAEVGLAVPAPWSAGAVQVVGFSNRVRDMIDFDFARNRFANVARAAQDGVETSLVQAIGDGRVRLGATWLEARDGNGQALLRRARWTGSASWWGPLPLGMSGEVALVYVGERDDIDPLSFARVHQSSFVTASASVSVPVTEWLAVRLRGENLGDRSYQEVRGYPAPGRRVMVGLESWLR